MTKFGKIHEYWLKEHLFNGTIFLNMVTSFSPTLCPHHTPSSRLNLQRGDLRGPKKRKDNCITNLCSTSTQRSKTPQEEIDRGMSDSTVLYGMSKYMDVLHGQSAASMHTVDTAFVAVFEGNTLRSFSARSKIERIMAEEQTKPFLDWTNAPRS